MKVTFVVDHLLERNVVSRSLEVLLPIFQDHDIDILTLSHLPSAVGIPIEGHKITSTFLSKIAKRIDLLQEKSFLIPGAMKGLAANHKSDLYFILSSGWAHLIAPHLNPKSQIITYIVEANGQNYLPQSLLSRMLSKAFEKAALSSKTLRGHLLFASESHSHIFNQAPVDVVEPVFEVDVFNFVRDQDFKFAFPWVVVFADMKTKLADLERLSDFVHKLNTKLVVISTSPNLQKSASSLKAEIRVMTKEVYQHHVPTALFCVDLTTHEFPYFSLGAMALGRPVVSDGALIYLGPTYGLYAFTEKALNEISRDALEMERAKLRRVALRMNGRFFKKQMLHFMKERLPSFQSGPQNFQ